MTSPTDVALRVAQRLGATDHVVAVVLGGSRARGDADESSDVDLGIFYHADQPPDLAALRALARELDDRHPENALTDYGDWGPWMNGGGWLVIEGVRVDWLYRDLTRVAGVIAECEAGQSTRHYLPGFPHAFHSHTYMAEAHYGRALVDHGGAFAALRARTVPYPARLRAAIIRSQLWEAGFSVENARKPARRGDVVFVSGCLYRSLACLLQTLFALNERYFLHDKRAVAIAAGFALRPAGFAETAAAILAALGDEPAALTARVERTEALIAATRALCESAAPEIELL